ncbi:MAG: tRNA uridine-5-carboxymethylaminomethyl(34) synthesis GTPase MnmE [Pseudomonadota bacterium]
MVTIRPQHDTIAAIITPPGFGGVGIVRLSGKGVRSVFKRIWKGRAINTFEARKLYLGKIISSDSDVIDEVLTVYFKEKSSYTGEETYEIFGHGGQIVMKEILTAALIAGARSAEPGEFTKRAFLNGKLDLAQAESVADLISSLSTQSLKVANRQLSGVLSKEINKIKDSVIELRSICEASLDFTDDDAAVIESSQITTPLSDLIDRLEDILATYNEGRILKEGVQVAIIGAPNVGKSSLFNELIKEDRAIVHEEAGTTRDIISESITIGGLPYFLHDSAGLRQTPSPIESIGIGRARELMERTDLKLIVFDSSKEMSSDDKELISQSNDNRAIIVLNKSDLASRIDRSIFPQNKRITSVSAKTGSGMDELKQMMSEIAQPSHTEEGITITNARHKTAIESALSEFMRARDLTETDESYTFVAYHLRMAQDHLSEITGEVVDEDVLNRIFSKFCIGK